MLSFFLGLFIIYFYLFFGCTGSLLLRTVFLQLRQVGVTLRCGAQASHCGGFSCCRAWALGVWASVVVARGLSSCGLRALERRLSSCGARAQLLRGMWDLPRPGLEPPSLALAGGFLTTAPPGKSYFQFFKEPPYCSPQWLYQFTFPPTVKEGSLFSTPSPAFIVCRFFDDGHSDWCEVIPHCSFDLHFSNNQ